MTPSTTRRTMYVMVGNQTERDRSGSSRPIASDLERDRLRHRERRLRMVLDVLRERARARPDEIVPAPLAEAIRGFEAELDAVRRTLTGR